MPVFRPRNPRLPDGFPHRFPAELRAMALRPVTMNHGTRYDCTPNELRDATTPSDQPRRTHVSADRASQVVFLHNQPGRNLSDREYDAMLRLEDLILGVFSGRKQWTPDIIIKVFCDLDRVFFLGNLRGHVYVKFKSGDAFPPARRDHCHFGRTIPLGGGKAKIHLNADALFGPYEGPSFKEMFRIVLHEMCHAYERTQVASQNREMNHHGLHFGTKIMAVHARARSDLQIGAVDRGHHFDGYTWDRRSRR